LLAFEQLTTCRAWGDIPGPIPWTAINDWAIANDLSGSDKQDFILIIMATDNSYLTAWHQKRKAELKRHGNHR
jgi:hypothetical protein